MKITPSSFSSPNLNFFLDLDALLVNTTVDDLVGLVMKTLPFFLIGSSSYDFDSFASSSTSASITSSPLPSVNRRVELVCLSFAILFFPLLTA